MNSPSASTHTGGPVPMVEPEYLAPLITAASDLALVVDTDGKIISVLVDEASDIRGHLSGWTGHSMHDFLTVESVPKFDRALSAVAREGGLKKEIELNHAKGEVWQHPVRYSFHKVGPDGSVLMLGRDLRVVAETQEQLVQAQIALERGYEERRENDAFYRVLLANVRDAYIFISDDGRIRDLNAAAATLLDAVADQLVGTSIAKEFKNRRKGEFVDTIFNSAVSKNEKSLVVQTARSNRELRLIPDVFRAAGERIAICRLAPANPEREVEDNLRLDLAELFKKSTDGILVTDNKGVILESNEAFLELANIANMSSVKGRSLADFLQRGQVDLSVLLENVTRSGHMRIYPTRLTNDIGTVSTVEISAAYLNERDTPAIALVIRDAERAMVVRSASASTEPSENASRSVSELVGSSSLKEIVAETSDVVERMCIETAIELTRNNRAAAAEMLGISRQSLYVKLRKYGLVDREDE